MGDVDGARPNQDTILQSRCDYSQLDRRRNQVRIRLNSTVVDVEPARRHRKTASITYVNQHGSAERVRANARGDGLLEPGHGPARRRAAAAPDRGARLRAQGAAGLLPRRPAQLAGVRGRADLQREPAREQPVLGQHEPVGGRPLRLVYGPTPNTPAQPATLGLSKVPGDPRAQTQLESYERGREELLRTSFRDFERAIIDVIDRSVNKAGGDFDPERDIESIMVNRWNYGYAYELTSTFDPSLYGPNAKQPHVIGRKPFRNVAIANSDSGAFAYTHSAINEAYRAVQELP